MRKMKLLALALVGVMGLTVFTGCGETKKTADTNKKVEDTKKDGDKKDETKKEDTKKEDSSKEASKPGQGTGFEEFPIDMQKEVGPYIVSPVYFQPVDMYPDITSGVKKEDAACHLEADIHLLPEKSVAFGFGAAEKNEDGELEGAWVPYLSVNYKIIDSSGKTVDEGTFMPMNAEDGPHYGANIKKDALSNGKYKLQLTIVPPKEYLLHIDEETGVIGAREGKKDYEEFFKEYTVEFDWDYEVQW